MSVFMISLDPYRYHHIPCTGTELQPDTLSIFIKNKDGDFIVHHSDPSTSFVGKWVPVHGSYVGIVRTVSAAQAIFDNLSKSNASDPNDLWNSFKNLFRGIAEACPFSGIFLIIYDSIRNSVLINANICKEIQNENSIAGIAIDGKVCMTISLNQLDRLKVKPTSDKHRLAIFKFLNLEFLKKLNEKGRKEKMADVFPSIKKAIEEEI